MRSRRDIRSGLAGTARIPEEEPVVPVSCPPTNAFHVGIRVVDLEAAMADLGPPLGVTWCQVQERDQRVWTPEGGARTTPLRFTYSAEGPVHLELLQGQPGTIWDAGDGAGVHHSGVWSDDVKGESDALVADGWSMLGAQLPPEDGYGAMTYVVSPSGFVVELVSTAVRPMFERWWAGGPLA